MMTKKYVELQNRLAELQQGKDEGAGMVEYGLLVAFIALVALVGVKLLGGRINNLFSGISFS